MPRPPRAGLTHLLRSFQLFRQFLHRILMRLLVLLVLLAIPPNPLLSLLPTLAILLEPLLGHEAERTCRRFRARLPRLLQLLLKSALRSLKILFDLARRHFGHFVVAAASK